MNKFYIVQYMGLSLQMNNTGHVFTNDLNSANRFEFKQHAFYWIKASEDEHMNLPYWLDVVECELIDGEWKFTVVEE